MLTTLARMYVYKATPIVAFIDCPSMACIRCALAVGVFLGVAVGKERLPSSLSVVCLQASPAFIVAAEAVMQWTAIKMR